MLPMVLFALCFFIIIFIETYLYRDDIISSQAILVMCPIVIVVADEDDLMWFKN